MQNRGAQIFLLSGNHLKILGARRVTWKLVPEMRTHKHWAPTYKILPSGQLGTQDLCTPVVKANILCPFFYIVLWFYMRFLSLNNY